MSSKLWYIYFGLIQVFWTALWARKTIQGRHYATAMKEQRRIAWFSLNFILKTSCVALYSVVCEMWGILVSPDQISTFSNIYRHTSPLLTMYHLISSSTNLYWPSTSQYRHILTQYHQVPLIIHHLMSHAQYTWSSFYSLFDNVPSNPTYWACWSLTEKW